MVSGNISRAVGLLRPNELVYSRYLVCYLNSSVGRQAFLKPSAGSAQIVVNLLDLNKLEIPLPSVSEQIKIAELLSDVDLDLSIQGSRLAKLRHLKAGMMQQLLTGKIRLV